LAALNHAHKAPKELDVEIIGVKAISLFSYYSPLVMLVSALRSGRGGGHKNGRNTRRAK